MTLADYVRARRSELGLSLRLLADRCGVTKTHIHSIEKGNSTNLKVSGICQLAAGLQVDAVTLFRVAAGLSPSSDDALNSP